MNVLLLEKGVRFKRRAIPPQDESRGILARKNL